MKKLILMLIAATTGLVCFDTPARAQQPAGIRISALATSPVDTAANAETKALYEFLRLQFGHRIISGQTHDYYDQAKTLTGLSPMLRAGDFQSYTNGYPYLWDNEIGGHTFGKYDNGTVSQLINWYNSTGGKGIVSLHWHWHSPTGGAVSTNTFYTENTSFDITQAVIPGTREYDSIISDIDEIAAQLKRFRDAGIPVLWRPLHEAGGGWFWWGAKGSVPCLALYDILFDRLKNHHQLHNLIWVWSTPEPSWYPGNDKVDIIGYDSYPGAYNYTSQKSMFDALYALTRGEKPVAMTENGPIPEPSACLEQEVPWLYFMSWSNLVTAQNSTQHIRKVFETPEVLKLESDNTRTTYEWHSSLYPENWVPGYRDSQRRYLHDFSYAGYHMGERTVPAITENVVDVTQPPYLADNTGATDVTGVIQQALNDVGSIGGGVVYLPAGTYRISAADTSSCALRLAFDSTVLRGAGSDATFILNSQTNMRYKDIIQVKGDYAGWFDPTDAPMPVVIDLPELTRVIPVESVIDFQKGDEIVVTSTPTDEFIEEHNMTGRWTATAIKGVAFLRRIDSIDNRNNLIYIDAPTRYTLKTRDDARVYHINRQISECGIENLSVGNLQNPNSGWDEESYATSGTGAYEVHGSHVIQFRNSENCWVKKVSTYKPSVNSGDYHLLSNCLKLNQCRFITVDSCSFEKPQYEGGGGNGYLYTLESNDCLISNSRANHSRHNYDFKYPYSNGNVILKCRSENSKYASDFHMYLSMANLFDHCMLNRDYLESAFRPYGSNNALHGYTSSQSVFYNIVGEAYHPNRNYLIDSRQFGWGYIIGTSGAAYEVETEPAEGFINGYPYDTNPRDFVEGTGNGDYLTPVSLYLDQLSRRQHSPVSRKSFQVTLVIRDKESNEPLQGSAVIIYNDTLVTDISGKAVFGNVPELFRVDARKAYYAPAVKTSYLVSSDTTLTIHLAREEYNVDIRLFRFGTHEPITGTSVTLGTNTGVSNDTGSVSFIAFGGDHILAINKTNYEPVSYSVLVERPTVVEVYLVQTHANVKISLTAGSTPVNQATVIVAEDTVISNAAGTAGFNHMPVSTEYAYKVYKNGFADREGNFFLSRDTTINIGMEKMSALQSAGIMKFSYWPNPVTDVLHMHTPDNRDQKTILISDMAGRELHRQESVAERIAVNTAAFYPGTYLLQVVASDRKTVVYFVKN